MATVKDDGGQAFPAAYTVGPNDDLYPPAPGMTLRDWFAGQALAGQLAFSPHDSFDKFHMPDEVAALTYRMADAMIAARLGVPTPDLPAKAEASISSQSPSDLGTLDKGGV